MQGCLSAVSTQYLSRNYTKSKLVEILKLEMKSLITLSKEINSQLLTHFFNFNLYMPQRDSKDLQRTILQLLEETIFDKLIHTNTSNWRILFIGYKNSNNSWFQFRLGLPELFHEFREKRHVAQTISSSTTPKLIPINAQWKRIKLLHHIEMVVLCVCVWQW